MENAPDGAAWSDADLDDLFHPLAHLAAVVLAVSGGSDSTALMLLFARWAARHSRLPRTLVLTVDHGLRPEAAAEAIQVADQAAALGLGHRTLAWDGPKSPTNLQDAARQARYRLLAAAAREVGAAAIVTAHTRDDQAETFLLALARGSGVYGLAAMPADRALPAELDPAADISPPPLRLIRPLLATPKSRLVATLQASGMTWSEDPSNTNEKFTRVALRKAAPALSALGLTPATLAATAARMARAAAALDMSVDRLISGAVTAHRGGFLQLDLPALFAEPEEIRLRTLARLLRAVAAAPHGPRLERLERLHRQLATALAEGTPLKATLGGTVALVPKSAASASRRCLWLMAEAGRDGFPVLDLRPGETAIWDGRIRVSLITGAGHPLQVRALGPDGRRQLPALARRDLPNPAVESICSAWLDDRLVAVPALDVATDSAQSIQFSAASLLTARLGDDG